MNIGLVMGSLSAMSLRAKKMSIKTIINLRMKINYNL